MERLEVVNLYKEYDDQPLLNGVNIHVESGETLCLLGSSGSGKSTILRIIAGIEKPDSGAVLWNGKDLAGVPVYKRNFGLMFQDYGLFPHLNVAENVAFGLKMRGLSKSVVAERLTEALDRVNMLAFRDRRVTDLSGGEQQRIALARALAPSPGLLMLDEPLAALDRSMRVELQEELRHLLKISGIPAVYVTHDQEEALVVSDRLALLNGGTIVQCDQTDRVFRFPANRWAAGFLGMINFLEGTVISENPLRVRTDCGILTPINPRSEVAFFLGDQVSLLIKPVGIGEGKQNSEINQLSGIIEETSFRGDHYRLRVKVSPGRSLEFLSTESKIEGEKTWINLSEEDVIILAD